MLCGQAKLQCHHGKTINETAQRSQRLHSRLHATRNTSRPSTTLGDVAKEQQAQQAASPFGKLVDYFLNRASSSLKRGPATCLTCKGKGSCTCPICQGAGIVDKAPQLDPVRHTVQKLQQVIGVDRAEYKTDWQVTNRCLHCHGAGLVLCPDCGGLGMRSPTAKIPQHH
eukprot:GHUV01001693.1.p1 GENE.GHUV01001693.1~~GHUV01001693.1.p1  ORF type:complete len:169 (+),score=33.56 GHUV01001693.1:295-801(+)